MIFNVFPLILSDYNPTNLLPIISISSGDSEETYANVYYFQVSFLIFPQ